jgi:DNA-binding NarL/FixJ family response regulator
MRVVIADDELLLREGLQRLLEEAGLRVVAAVGTPAEARRQTDLTRPDVAIIDIRMPPTHTDEGIVVAEDIRQSHPDLGILVLSNYLASHYAMRLIEHHPARTGYLLKGRISHVAVLVDALRRLGDGECVIDPTIVTRLMTRAEPTSRLDALTAREREVLALMAEGRSNAGIAHQLWVTEGTVEKHVRSILTKLTLPETGDDHRRVLAVLRFLDTR